MGTLLLVAGVLVHIVFLYSIFDIYFTSPLVHGMTPHATPLPSPAKRLVLFVADGLRADKLFELDENKETRAPFLRSVIETEGAWGVSHTRVPTESRPGHVAIIAGFYEDVSAIAKGWKENPVEFDSLFNESRYTWSWGSPDILPMFAKGASGDHVFTHTYPAESEDFAGTDLFKLDTWVFDRVKEFFESSYADESLKNKLQQDKIVFFLHLLGLDTNGHAHKPMSKEYLNNIRIMDEGVRKTVEFMESYYNSDGKTAYILTSDHGMTNWGSHGAGDPHETLTPIVAWGAGFRTPLLPNSKEFEDGYSKDWGLQEKVKRSDVNQADLSPLMASVIGVSWPLNSVGILPLDYLDNTLQYKAESIFSNAQQILAQYEIKMAEKQHTTMSAVFRPFTKLTPSVQADRIRQIRMFVAEKNYQEAITESQKTIQLALEGLNYYHSYDRFFLGVSIASGFVGWMAYILVQVLTEHTNIVKKKLRIHVSNDVYKERAIRIGFYIFRVLTVFLLYIQSLQWTYYVYCLLPTLLWQRVVERHYVFSNFCSKMFLGKLFSIFLCVIAVLGLEIIVMSFFHRELLSLGLVLMAFWPLFEPQWVHFKGRVIGWILSCIVVAVFPLLPVVGREANYSLVTLAGCAAIMATVWCLRRPESSILTLGKRKRSQQVLGVTLIQVFLLSLAVYIVQTTAISISAKDGLPLFNQIISWIILGTSFLLPLLSETQVLARLLNISLALLAPYLLLSTSHEGLFCIALCSLLLFWILLEHAFSRSKQKLEDTDFSESTVIFDEKRLLVLSDLRCAYIFVFLVITAFFGTGNIASINSFDPSSVYCFLTIFNPFVMGTLMLWKVIIPFLLVTCTFSGIHVALRVPTKSLFLIVLLMSDFMGLHFFFLVRDSGSWLEIGTSISHYVIVMCMIIFICLLLGLAKLLTTVKLLGNKTHSQ